MSAHETVFAWSARLPPEAKLLLLALAEAPTLARAAELAGLRIGHAQFLAGALRDAGFCDDDFAVIVPRTDPVPDLPPAYRKAPIPRELREAVFERDGHRCLHCGTTENLTVDHVIPEIRGGETTMENCQSLCKSCNSKKGTR